MLNFIKNNSFFLVFLVMLGIATPIWALENADEISQDSVVVTATKTEKKLLDVQYSVSVITAEEVEKTPVLQFQDLLKNIPGVQVANWNNSESNRIFIRGEGDQETLVLIDGVKVSTVFHGHGSNLIIDPSSIERVEVIKGPATVIYGAEALGGVVNIITRKGGGKVPFQGNLSSTYMSSDNGSINSGSVYGRVNDTTYRLFGSYANFASVEYYHTDDEDRSRVLYSFGGDLGYDFTEKIHAGMGYEYNNQKAESASFSNTQSRKSSNRFTGNFSLKELNSFLPLVKADMYYYTNDHGYDGAKKGDIFAYVTDADLVNYGVNIQSNWSFSPATYMILGYEWLHEDLDYKRTYNLKGKLGPAGLYQIRDAGQDTHALYASIDHTFLENFVVNGGVRLIYFNTGLDDGHYYLPDGSLLYFDGRPYGIGGDDGNETKAVFTASVVWSGIDNLALRALWSQGFRPPSFYKKYLDIPMGHSGFVHNPDLKPEFSNSFELGARYETDTVTADVAAFYTLTDDRIATAKAPYGKGFASKWVNAYETKTYGLEFQFAYEFSGIEPYISGTWIHRNEKTPGNDSEYFQDVPPLFGRLGVRYKRRIWNGVRCNADLYAEYEDSFDYMGFDSSFNRVKRTTESFTTLNLSFGFDWKQYYAQFEILNIFDKKYKYQSNSKPEPGCNANVIIGIHF